MSGISCPAQKGKEEILRAEEILADLTDAQQPARLDEGTAADGARFTTHQPRVPGPPGDDDGDGGVFQ